MAGKRKASKRLHIEFRSGHDISREIRDFSFIIAEYKCPFYGLQEEIEQIPESCVNGDFIIQNDERLVEVLGRITVMCLACLKQAMKGESLPVKEGGL